MLDWLERLGEYGTGWRGWVMGGLVGEVGCMGDSFHASSPPSSLINLCLFVHLLRCLFVCFKTGFPLPVYFLFLPSVFKQPST